MLATTVAKKIPTANQNVASGYWNLPASSKTIETPPTMKPTITQSLTQKPFAFGSSAILFPFDYFFVYLVVSVAEDGQYRKECRHCEPEENADNPVNQDDAADDADWNCDDEKKCHNNHLTF